MDVAEERMGRATAEVEREAKTLLNKAGQGRASKPGEPPRKQSGRLYGSIHTRVVRMKNEIQGYIYSDDEKARRLELGFVGKDALGRVYDQKPRPFMRPALAKAAAKIKKI